MKILILPSWYYIDDNDTSGVFFKELAESLATDENNQVAILYFDIRRRIRFRDTGLYHFEVNSVHEFRYKQKNYFPKSPAGMNFQICNAYKKCADKVISDFGLPDIVHLESCMRLDIAEMLQSDYGIPFVFTEHFSGILNGTCSKKILVRFNRALSESHGNICISSVFEKKNIELGHMDNFLIPNGVNVNLLPDTIKRDSVFRVKALGRLNPIKGFDSLIRGFALFAADKEDVILEIGGAGPEYENLLRVANSLGIVERVRFAGEVKRKDIGAFYGNCSVFVCSSLTETFSIVTAEALCSGIPVISTKCGGPQDLVNEKNGFLIDIGSTSQLVNALNSIYYNRDQYDNNKIKRHARELYSLDSVCRQHLEAYSNAILTYEKSKDK